MTERIVLPKALNTQLLMGVALMVCLRAAPAVLMSGAHLFDDLLIDFGDGHNGHDQGDSRHGYDSRNNEDRDNRSRGGTSEDSDNGEIQDPPDPPDLSQYDMDTAEGREDALKAIKGYLRQLNLSNDAAIEGASEADLRNSRIYVILEQKYQALLNAISALNSDIAQIGPIDKRLDEIETINDRLFNDRLTALAQDDDEMIRKIDEQQEEIDREQAGLLKSRRDCIADIAAQNRNLARVAPEYKVWFESFQQELAARENGTAPLDDERPRGTRDVPPLRGTETPEMLANNAVQKEINEGNALITRIDKYLAGNPRLDPDVAGGLTADRKLLADQLQQLQQMLERAQRDGRVTADELRKIEERIEEIKNLHRNIESTLPSEHPRWRRRRRAEDPNDIER